VVTNVVTELEAGFVLYSSVWGQCHEAFTGCHIRRRHRVDRIDLHAAVRVVDPGDHDVRTHPDSRPKPSLTHVHEGNVRLAVFVLFAACDLGNRDQHWTVSIAELGPNLDHRLLRPTITDGSLPGSDFTIDASTRRC